MIRAEWEYLKKHKFMTIVLIAIIFIPSIYSVTFLKSMWDPYGELENIPVAVVNHDQSVNYQGTKLDVGNSLAKNLKKSDAMDFKVMSAKQARDGLDTGKYYMTITIPKGFSKNATTLLNKKPKKMVLNYETSAGHNYVASKMTASAAKQAAQSVSEEVTNTYAKTMFSSIKQLSNGMSKAAKGSKKLGDGTQQLVSANQTMTTGLDQLASSTLTFEDGANTLNSGLSTYINGVSSAASGSSTLASGLNQLNGSTSSLSSGVSQLATGSNTLTNGIQSYTAGVSSVNSGASSLSNGTSQLASGTNTLATSANSLNSGMDQIYAASNELTQQLQNLANGTADSSQLQQTNDSINTVQSQLDGNNSSQATSIKKNLTTLQQSIDKQLKDQVTNIKQSVSATADSQGLSADQKAALLSAVDTGSNQTDSTALNDSISSLSTDLNNLVSAQAGMSSDLTTAIQRIAAASGQLTDSIQTANSGMGELANGINSLQASSNQLASGAGQVSAGTAQLMNNNASLNNGAASLNSGIAQLNGQVPTLTSGVSQLASGANQLDSGLQQLNANGSTITSGAGQLASGASQISSGATQLQSGSTQMGSGLDQVNDGTTDLTTQLANGAKKSKVDPTKLTYAQVAKPTTTKHTERDDAPNNGTGMAPYMISVSLFVGALAFNLMFDLYTPRKYPHSGMGWWASKASLKSGFAVLESVTVYILLRLIDGLAPIHPFATLLVIFLTGMTFMGIVSWLNLVAGKVGAFISMILLVLQLGGSAGTYPIQLSNGFFNAINPWLPMSYSVSGLRDSLMTGNSAWPEMLVLLAITAVFMGMTMLFYIRRRSRIKEMDFNKDVDESSLVK